MRTVNLEKIQEAWEKETDERILKAATKNLNDYSPEVCVIIFKETIKRELIAYKIKETDSNGTEFEVMVTEKGQDILAGLEERSPKEVSIKLLKTFIVFLFVAITFGLVGLMFGLSAGILAATGGYILFLGIRKIWPSEEVRNIQRQQSREALKWMEDHPDAEETQQIMKSFEEIFNEIMKDSSETDRQSLK